MCKAHSLLLGRMVRLEQKSILRTKQLEMRQISSTISQGVPAPARRPCGTKRCWPCC